MLCRLFHGLQRRRGRRLRCRCCGELLQTVSGRARSSVPAASRPSHESGGLHPREGLGAGQAARGYIVFYLKGDARPRVWCVGCTVAGGVPELAAHLERCHPGAEFVGAIITPDRFGGGGEGCRDCMGPLRRDDEPPGYDPGEFGLCWLCDAANR